jgi:hypothetical protein
MTTLNARPCTFHPEWLDNPPFHLRPRLKDGEPHGTALVCQCGNDRFVFGSTPGFAYCLECRGEVTL